MPLNIYTTLKPLLKGKKFNYDYESIIEFIEKYYRVNQYIYPGVLHRNLGIDIKDIYSFLDLCSNANILKPYFEVYCQNCNRFTGVFFDSIFSIPEEIECPHCNNDIDDLLKSSVVIYKVIAR